MASSKEYLQFILEQLSDLEEITYRTMMGEYIIYYREKVVGGIYDDRLLVKPVKAAVTYMSEGFTVRLIGCQSMQEKLQMASPVDEK